MSIYSEVRAAIRKGSLKALEDYFPTSTEQNAGIIFSHVSGPEPSTPYVVINILGHSQIGHQDQSTLADENEQLSIQVQYEVRAQFSFCGSLAGDMCQTFNQRIRNNVVVWEEFQKNNLQIREKSDPRRAPQKRETQWVEYWNMDVTFAYCVETRQDIDVVEHVIIKDVNSGFELIVPPLP